MNSLLEPIEYISTNFGPRIAGSDSDHKTIEYVEKQFLSFTPNVMTEEFNIVGRSLQFLIQFLVWGYFVSTLCYFFYAPLVPALTILKLLIFYLARFQDRNLVNLFVKKSKSKNIIATFEPTIEKKNIVIFSAHHDSAFHMPLFEKKVKEVTIIQNGAIGGMILLLISGIWKGISYFVPAAGILRLFEYSLGSLTVSWFLLPDILFLISLGGSVLAFYFLKNMVTKTPVVGANDNLSSVAVLFALGEFLKENPPQNLEIRLISFGGEEPGMVGSTFYVKRNLEKLKDAVNINFENLGSGELGVIEKEKDNNIEHNMELIRYLQKVANKHGFKLPAKKVHYGNTDAGSFSKRNITATTVFCFGEDDIFDLWHSTEDIVDNLDEKNLRYAFEFSLKIIEEIEKEVINKDGSAWWT